MLNETSLTPAAHLTCVNASRAEVDEVIRGYWDARRAPHRGAARRPAAARSAASITPRPDGYANATELTAGIRAIAPFEVSVGLHPQSIPRAASLARDIDVLKAKVDAGATRAITQFFFDVDGFLRFRDAVRAAGIAIPIWCRASCRSPTSPAWCGWPSRCGIPLPDWLGNLFEGLDDDPATRRLVAASVAAEMCAKLEEEGFDDFHFYTLNRAELTSSHLPGAGRARGGRA